MLNSEFKKRIGELGDGYQVQLSTYAVVESPDNEEGFYVVEDAPIIGILVNEEDKEIRLMVESDWEAIVAIERKNNPIFFESKFQKKYDEFILQINEAANKNISVKNKVNKKTTKKTNKK